MMLLWLQRSAEQRAAYVRAHIGEAGGLTLQDVKRRRVMLWLVHAGAASMRETAKLMGVAPMTVSKSLAGLAAFNMEASDRVAELVGGIVNGERRDPVQAVELEQLYDAISTAQPWARRRRPKREE